MNNHKVFGVNGKEIFTDTLLHSGEVLGEELVPRGISKKDFAELIDLRPPHLNELIKRKRHVSALLALKLEKQLGISATFWLRLQIFYDLRMARKQLKFHS